MLGIDSTVAYHQLKVDPDTHYVSQRRRRHALEKAKATTSRAKGLLYARFISEVKYTKWFSNVVRVKKVSGMWRDWVDYTDLNRAFPKDSYHLPNIDKLVNNSFEYMLLSFMDAYSGYNRIPVFGSDKMKTTFMIEQPNYQYNVMPFGLKNVGITY